MNTVCAADGVMEEEQVEEKDSRKLMVVCVCELTLCWW